MCCSMLHMQHNAFAHPFHPKEISTCQFQCSLLQTCCAAPCSPPMNAPNHHSNFDPLEANPKTPAQLLTGRRWGCRCWCCCCTCFCQHWLYDRSRAWVEEHNSTVAVPSGGLQYPVVACYEAVVAQHLPGNGTVGATKADTHACGKASSVNQQPGGQSVCLRGDGHLERCFGSPG